MDLSLSQRLSLLPPELHTMILEWYRRLYLNTEIKEKKAKLLIHLKTELTPNINLNDFIEIGDFAHFNYLIQNKPDYEYITSFAYLAKCIIGCLEYYYSLKYDERRELQKSLLLENKYYEIKKSMYEDNHLTEFLKNKKLSYLIDPDDLHSGSTGNYCYNKVMVFAFGNYETKVDSWLKLVKGYF